MTVSDLTKGAEYFFTVSGVNAEGGVGEVSVPSQTVQLKSQCFQETKSNINNRIDLYVSDLSAPLQPAFSSKYLITAVLSWIIIMIDGLEIYCK